MPVVADHSESDARPNATGSDRFCVVSRRSKPVDEMIRFVAGPNGVVPDLKCKLPGRGVWVTATRPAVVEAVKRGAFQRGFRSGVAVAADLPDLVERLFVRAALDALAVAHKAGLVAVGFAKAETAITGETVVALIHAAEASDDGIRKLAAARKRRLGEAEKTAVVRTFASAQLDLALGRINVVHAALLAGRASDTFIVRWRRLERFRLIGDDQASADESGWSDDPVQPEAGRELGLE